MKRTPFLAGGVFVFFTLTALAQAAAVTSEISAVTVYTDRARVTRSGRVTLPAGESEWTFEKLPAGILDDSVQVSGTGLSGVSILDVSSKIGNTVAAVDPRIQSLETDIRTLERKARVVADKVAGLEKQRGLLEKIEDAVTAPPGKERASQQGFEDWSKLLKFSDESREKFATAALALEDEKVEIEAQLAAKRADLGQLKRGIDNGRAFKTVIVRLSSVHAGEVDLGLNYAVVGAGWHPSYDARLRSMSRQVELSYFGTVRQNTGEDWNNIALVLSTAQPSLGAAAPTLGAWIVDVQPPPNSMVYGMVAARKRDDAAGEEEAKSLVTGGGAIADTLLSFKDGPTDGFRLNEAILGSSLTNSTFTIPSRTTVKSDFSAQKVSIATGVLPAKLKFESAPRLQETVFLTASVQNMTDYPLLGGPANVFLDDTFVATSALKTVMPTEKFDVAMGADEGISVKRRLVSRFKEDTGLTNGGRRVTFEYLVTLTNNKKTAETVLLRDTIPVSRNEKIVVKLLAPQEKEISTKDKPREVAREEDGKLLWTLELKAGEKREVPLKFSIDYPGDVPVTGVE